MKKILVGLTALALLAMAAGPALANCLWCDGEQYSVGNGAIVINNVGAASYTGGNGIANSSNNGMGVGGNISSNNDNNKITTGDATAYAGAINVVNSNVALDGCCGPKEQYVGEWNWAEVDNEVMAIAATGGNGIANSENDDMGVGGNISSNNDRNTINTGNAESNVYSIVVINSNISRILR